ncbi:2-dehydropantoate 2-reductase [Hahella chejuensis KCTC 2396]|uniref:2-dehydropantoate 2-reductase n=1 Tax=Hahella chejuensis (strain KCTC 2396) TaxID=349521 RepID=Q2SKR4_HAHCH|nr:putative 2-dehydropantoate 2-reductase [Hahella chejuensis]ABC28760.1 2-dehydropantoate 2-reductase [Hahella chejuensis KCTC 2396]
MRHRIHILGNGSLGGLLACRLSPFVDVRMILRSPPYPQSNTDDKRLPLTLDLAGERQSWRFDWETADAAEPISTLFLTTKSYSALNALDSIRHRLTPASRILLWQNGMGSQMQIAQEYADMAVYAASTTEGANRPEDGRIVHAGHGQTWVGPLSANAPFQEAQRLVDLLREAGFSSETTKDIRAQLWRKLSVNCGVNPFTVILNCRNGDILEHAYFQQRIDALCEELSAMLFVAGYGEPAANVKARIVAVAQGTANNISSMLQDVRAGRQTEINAINGFICDYADAHGQPHPVNSELTAGVHALSDHSGQSA